MKPFYLSKTVWLGVAVAVLAGLEQAQTLELPTWAIGLIGAAIVFLRSVTSKGIGRSRVVAEIGKVGLVLFIILGGLGCGAASVCQTIEIVKKPHPSKPAPAARLVHKCGESSTQMDVDTVPACLDACFK